MDCIPVGELPGSYIPAQGIDVSLSHQLAAKIDPCGIPGAVELPGHGSQSLAVMGFDMLQDIHHGIMYNHVSVGMIAIIRVTDALRAPGFLHALPEDFKPADNRRVAGEQFGSLCTYLLHAHPGEIHPFLAEPRLGRPPLKQSAADDGFLDAVGSISFKFNVLVLCNPLVTILEFPSVACECIHIVSPPERGR